MKYPKTNQKTQELGLEWSKVVNYEEYYLVSSCGLLKSLGRECPHYRGVIMVRKEKLLRVYEHPSGYNVVTLIINKKRKLCSVHRLVAEAFIPNPENKPQVNHIDGDRRNNHVSNLEWCTNYENAQHAIKTGLVNYTNEDTVRAIRKLKNAGLTCKIVANKFSVSKAVVYGIFQNKTWKNII